MPNVSDWPVVIACDVSVYANGTTVLVHSDGKIGGRGVEHYPSPGETEVIKRGLADMESLAAKLMTEVRQVKDKLGL